MAEYLLYDGQYSGEQIDAFLSRVERTAGSGPLQPEIAGVQAVELPYGQYAVVTKREESDGSISLIIGVPRGRDGIDGAQGVQGERGNPFTYDDFTPEQLEALTGPQGPQGEPGKDGEDGPPGPQGIPGTAAEKGATFTPHVDNDGNLSWTNDGDLDNPETVNIKGPQGPASFKIGHGLTLDRDTNTVSVDMYAEGKDETLPVSEAYMMAIVGDIETLLRAI